MISTLSIATNTYVLLGSEVRIQPNGPLMGFCNIYKHPARRNHQIKYVTLRIQLLVDTIAWQHNCVSYIHVPMNINLSCGELLLGQGKETLSLKKKLAKF